MYSSCGFGLLSSAEQAAAREYEEKVTFEHNAYAVARAKETERGVEKVNDEKIYREQVNDSRASSCQPRSASWLSDSMTMDERA